MQQPQGDCHWQSLKRWKHQDIWIISENGTSSAGGYSGNIRVDTEKVIMEYRGYGISLTFYMGWNQMEGLRLLTKMGKGFTQNWDVGCFPAYGITDASTMIWL